MRAKQESPCGGASGHPIGELHHASEHHRHYSSSLAMERCYVRGRAQHHAFGAHAASIHRRLDPSEDVEPTAVASAGGLGVGGAIPRHEPQREPMRRQQAHCRLRVRWVLSRHKDVARADRIRRERRELDILLNRGALAAGAVAVRPAAARQAATRVAAPH
eukprot:2575102-Prymnesium_polylepis.2